MFDNNRTIMIETMNAFDNDGCLRFDRPFVNLYRTLLVDFQLISLSGFRLRFFHDDTLQNRISGFPLDLLLIEIEKMSPLPIEIVYVAVNGL